MTEITAIIPARGGSKGLIGKNKRKIMGKPLISYTIEAALQSGQFSCIIVSTDDEEIIDIASAYDNVTVSRRPQKLAQDDTSMFQVVDHLVQSFKLKGSLCLLQPTSPLRTAGDISRAVSLFLETGGVGVISVTEAEKTALKLLVVESGLLMPISRPEYVFSNRQSLPNVVKPNGAIYLFDIQRLCDYGDFYTKGVAPYLMSEQDSIDIDTELDLVALKVQLNLKQDQLSFSGES